MILLAGNLLEKERILYMPLSVGQVQTILETYNKMLRTKRAKVGEKGVRVKDDVVTITSEARRRGLLDRIGDAAVKAYKETAINSPRFGSEG